MVTEVAYKRRAALENELEDKYYGQFISFEHPDGDTYYGRIQTIGIEWDGGNSFTVTFNLDGRRFQADYESFIQNTKIL